jgi:hypothetical protein
MTDARSAKEFRRFEPVASLENRSFFSFPEELAAQIIPEGKDTSSTALEALAMEEYSTEQISEAEIRRLLGFETRMEEHAFLKEHGAFLHYSPEDVAKRTGRRRSECARSGYRSPDRYYLTFRSLDSSAASRLIVMIVRFSFEGAGPAIVRGDLQVPAKSHIGYFCANSGG